jgi:hypothetical protein
MGLANLLTLGYVWYLEYRIRKVLSNQVKLNDLQSQFNSSIIDVIVKEGK